jgi:hypothetical protein
MLHFKYWTGRHRRVRPPRLYWRWIVERNGGQQAITPADHARKRDVPPRPVPVAASQLPRAVASRREGSMLQLKTSKLAAPCPDTTPLSLPAPTAPRQGDGAPSPARPLGSWNDETLAEVAQATARATVELEAAWPPRHPVDEIEAENSEQTTNESSIETPTTAAPARSWVKPLGVWAPGAGARSAVRQRNAKRIDMGTFQTQTVGPLRRRPLGCRAHRDDRGPRPRAGHHPPR